jgi:hypothetical protein
MPIMITPRTLDNKITSKTMVNKSRFKVILAKSTHLLIGDYE